MSHLNANENPTEANYTAVEMAARPQQSPTESRFKRIASSIGRQWEENGKVKFIITALGIFLSYMLVGYLQEIIMRGKYCDESDKCERYEYAVTLVCVQFLFSFTFIKALDIIKPEDKKDTTNCLYYILAAAANASAMVSSNKALKWVTYPMQVIFKSAKPISVMISGLFICKRYATQRYLFVLIIVIGVVVFKFFESDEVKKPKKTENKNEANTANYQLYGTALLILSLTMDGVLGAIQDKIRAVHGPTSRQFMLGMSAWGSVILVTVVIATGEFKDVFAFVSHHPNVILHICAFATAGVVGQLFIFTMVASFGSLACSVTTTVRKFFSVLFSIVFMGNPSTPLQWLGAALVFAGLFADAFFGKKHRPAQNQHETELHLESAENTERLVENTDEKPTITKFNTTQPNAQEIV
ncbi:solute carrier family 35 member B1 homolog [Sitodiplosis mosellana]|uniref:solute carrier family 35 member B1 homolog n=1 Tax=Sitodiplosis mosellana TaxID=263140 RepID=UPI00244440AF|nr:solute carrier family 35 member B1 homolog [Sitodiplosis mosellana]XP_055306532.1 solute carrier family 35 member B1 homolog [Sitodiplosis mosellana]XP_055306539.1 solute carrier family 35 member B1 homolog [Sitodiplosis mosellana]XP_055306543.1 solute carrier family 35 member B1 homolog [Sitodiplosis mosellana]XP_055306548.1 solute carrier family 35 member B1 homolog [Sitodiplosis mosellana]XP_055306555.1 solute carrier family 35 member B1 homolog [Sitodiplosis mosellana]XP_055306563.1 so